MAEHTPGPWTICLGSGRNLMTGVSKFWDDGRVTVIADCLPDYAFDGNRQPADHRPNMHLICAAPQMLSALKAIREAYRGCEHLVGPSMAAKIRAIDEAIAAAEPEGK